MSILSRLRQKYARVIVVVGATARLKRGAQLQGATLADVAAEIESFKDFSRLCREDLRDAWFNDSEYKGPRTVYNRCETWERLYRHGHVARGTPHDPPAIDISAADRSGSYQIKPAAERRTADSHWQRLLRAGRALHIPQAQLDAFQAANEHHYEEWERAQSAQAPKAPAAPTRGKKRSKQANRPQSTTPPAT